MKQECEHIQSEPLDADESSEILEIVDVDEEISLPEGGMKITSDDVF